MALHPQGAGGGLPPGAPLGGVASFRFTIPVQAPANAVDDDELETLADNPVISSLVFLPWCRPSAAGIVRVHRALLQGALLPGCKSDPTSPADRAALSSSNLFEQELAAGKTTDLAFAWFQAGLFDSPIDSVGLLYDRMCELTSKLPDPTVLFITSVDLQDVETFDRFVGALAHRCGSPALRGRGAVQLAPVPPAAVQPRPAALQPVLSVSWFDLLQE
jgi:hypothetical protein